LKTYRCPKSDSTASSLYFLGLYAEEDGFNREDLDDIMKLINYRAEESD
jgi:hypothetical protein